MIWDSNIWKAELIKEIKNFKKYLKQIKSERYDIEHFVIGIEKFHFICAFIMRKLIENNKLSDDLHSMNYPCGKYIRIQKDKPLDIFSTGQIGEYYDLMNCQMQQLNIKQICNFFIHSFMFYPTFDEENDMAFSGVFFNSDYDKDKFLFHIDYEIFVKLINDVIEDDISFIKIDRTSGKATRSKSKCIQFKEVAYCDDDNCKK